MSSRHASYSYNISLTSFQNGALGHSLHTVNQQKLKPYVKAYVSVPFGRACCFWRDIGVDKFAWAIFGWHFASQNAVFSFVQAKKCPTLNLCKKVGS